MAMNNYMHPRNIYKTPPDFAKLAENYPEFKCISKMDLSGKVTIDFKDPKSLRILTKCLLKSDFNVNIDIPEDKLVPTLPLRLNYILWIEDLMASIKRITNINGIDIGTGACAIYPVLGAIKNKWSMIGTETDEDSFQKAQSNIKINNLDSLIKLIKTPSSTIISFVLDNEKDQLFDFCMCNPPFYSSIQDLFESRSPARPPPKNAFTGSPQELITEGGELTFCRNLISESQNYKDRVRIFTTMIGHKYNLKELLQDLTAERIRFTHTEFCQGRVTRWGLAWTYQDYDIYKLVSPRDKVRKKNTPIAYSLPKLPECANNVESCTEKIKTIFQSLDIEYKLLNKIGNKVNMQFTATKDTWSHQRRKRRLMKRINENDAKKLKMNNETINGNSTNNPSDMVQEIPDANCHNTKNSKEHGDMDPIIQAFLKVFEKDDNLFFEVEYLSGSAGKEGLHQIVQYIKNNWK
ncbi:unnamed protein product [Diatraea saccharalis]|uniref:U6 small nuclear RNA (adenine-(43)-N(6))-methyltransferase n=1 Tax=Diatraea saccharalis TaxID=40085 RepID=A0A9P0C6B7_9NEOP|nr:unnamed protein product [Diatraea saccharalis]